MNSIISNISFNIMFGSWDWLWGKPGTRDNSAFPCDKNCLHKFYAQYHFVLKTFFSILPPFPRILFIYFFSIVQITFGFKLNLINQILFAFAFWCVLRYYMYFKVYKGRMWKGIVYEKFSIITTFFIHYNKISRNCEKYLFFLFFYQREYSMLLV